MIVVYTILSKLTVTVAIKFILIQAIQVPFFLHQNMIHLYLIKIDEMKKKGDAF